MAAELEELWRDVRPEAEAYTRSTIEVVLKPFARARNGVDANQSGCAQRSHTFTRGARRGRTVVLVNPGDHAQHVKERAVHENVTQGVMNSLQQHRREVSRLCKLGRDGSDDPSDKKTNERTHSG